MTPRDEKIQSLKKGPVKKVEVAQVVAGKVFYPQHMHTEYMEYWLLNFTSIGSCLNVCCGWSQVGNVRVDNSPDSNRTMEGDLYHLLWPEGPFQPEQFDFVYIDPLFKAYTTGENRFRWQFDAFKIAKRALITRRPKVNVNLPSKYHEYVILEDSRPSVSLLRIDYK